MIKPPVANEVALNRSVVFTGAVAAIGANDESDVRIVARLGSTEKAVRVSGDNLTFQIVALGTAKPLKSGNLCVRNVWNLHKIFLL